MIAVQDIKEQMELAGTEDDQEFNITGYSDDLLLCLAEEKGSVNEILIHLDELAIAFQNHVEELRRKKEGAGVEETEEEENFEDAKETGSITSYTSKTQHAVEDSHTYRNSNEHCSPALRRGGRTQSPCRSWAW